MMELFIATIVAFFVVAVITGVINGIRRAHHTMNAFRRRDD